MVKRSFFFVFASLVSIFALDLFGPNGLYAFDGHGRTLSYVSKVVLFLLCFTHVILASVMAARWKTWRPSESSIFRFISLKAIMWGWLMHATPIRSEGVSIPYVVLLILLSITTIDLDVRLIGRYIFGWEDGWDVPERAIITPGDSDYHGV